MSAGLEVYDAFGVKVIGVTDRLSRILDSFPTGSSSGSRIVPGLSLGTPFYFAVTVPSFANAGRVAPTIVLNKESEIVSWGFTSDNTAAIVTVGVF